MDGLRSQLAIQRRKERSLRYAQRRRDNGRSCDTSRQQRRWCQDDSRAEDQGRAESRTPGAASEEDVDFDEEPRCR